MNGAERNPRDPIVEIRESNGFFNFRIETAVPFKVNERVAKEIEKMTRFDNETKVKQAKANRSRKVSGLQIVKPEPFSKGSIFALLESLSSRGYVFARFLHRKVSMCTSRRRQEILHIYAFAFETPAYMEMQEHKRNPHLRAIENDLLEVLRNRLNSGEIKTTEIYANPVVKEKDGKIIKGETWIQSILAEKSAVTLREKVEQAKKQGKSRLERYQKRFTRA